MFCKFCGTENLSSSYCKRCGSKLESNTNPVITVNVNEFVPVQPIKVKKKKDTKRILVNLFLAFIETAFILQNLFAGLFLMSALTSETEGTMKVNMILTVVVPIILWIFFFSAILYVSIERSIKSLVIYLIPCIFLTLCRILANIFKGEDLISAFVSEVFIPVIFAVIVKALVLGWRKIKSIIKSKKEIQKNCQ